MVGRKVNESVKKRPVSEGVVVQGEKQAEEKDLRKMPAAAEKRVDQQALQIEELTEDLTETVELLKQTQARLAKECSENREACEHLECLELQLWLVTIEAVRLRQANPEEAGYDDEEDDEYFEA